AVVRPDEPVAVAVREHDAGHEIEVLRQAELAGAVSNQLAVSDHRLQAILERAAVRVGMDAELGGEALQRQRLARLLHRLADLVPARDRVLVSALAVVPGGPLSVRHQVVVRRESRAGRLMGNECYNEMLPDRRKRLTDRKAASTFVRLPARAGVAELV